MARIVFFAPSPNRLAIRYVPGEGTAYPKLRIIEMNEQQLEIAILVMERVLGPKLMLYEMKALTVPAKERHLINFDDETDPKRDLHWRWRALLQFRAEQRRRLKRELSKDP